LASSGPEDEEIDTVSGGGERKKGGDWRKNVLFRRKKGDFLRKNSSVWGKRRGKEVFG